MSTFVATAWKGGSYGLKVSIADRDRYFEKSWKSVFLELPNGRYAEANIDKPSFWNDSCRELIGSEIGKWFKDFGLVPWPKGSPPKIEILSLGNRQFRVALQVTPARG